MGSNQDELMIDDDLRGFEAELSTSSALKAALANANSSSAASSSSAEQPSTPAERPRLAKVPAPKPKQVQIAISSEPEEEPKRAPKRSRASAPSSDASASPAVSFISVPSSSLSIPIAVSAPYVSPAIDDSTPHIPIISSSSSLSSLPSVWPTLSSSSSKPSSAAKKEKAPRPMRLKHFLSSETLEPEPPAPFVLDIQTLLQRYLSKNSHSFAVFKATWTELNFSLIHQSKRDDGADTRFSAELFLATLSFLHIDKSELMCVAVFYALYMLYYTQPWTTKKRARIRISLSMWNEILDRIKTTPELGDGMFAACIRRLRSEHAILLVAHLEVHPGVASFLPKAQNAAAASVAVDVINQEEPQSPFFINPEEIQELAVPLSFAQTLVEEEIVVVAPPPSIPEQQPESSFDPMKSLDLELLEASCSNYYKCKQQYLGDAMDVGSSHFSYIQTSIFLGTATRDVAGDLRSILQMHQEDKERQQQEMMSEQSLTVVIGMNDQPTQTPQKPKRGRKPAAVVAAASTPGSLVLPPVVVSSNGAVIVSAEDEVGEEVAVQTVTLPLTGSLPRARPQTKVIQKTVHSASQRQAKMTKLNDQEAAAQTPQTAEKRKRGRKPTDEVRISLSDSEDEEEKEPEGAEAAGSSSQSKSAATRGKGKARARNTRQAQVDGVEAQEQNIEVDGIDFSAPAPKRKPTLRTRQKKNLDQQGMMPQEMIVQPQVPQPLLWDPNTAVSTMGYYLHQTQQSIPRSVIEAAAAAAAAAAACALPVVPQPEMLSSSSSSSAVEPLNFDLSTVADRL